MIIKEIKTSVGECGKRLSIYSHKGAFGILKSFSLVDDYGFKKFWEKSDYDLITIDPQNYSFNYYEYEIVDNNDVNFVTFIFLNGQTLYFSFNEESQIYSNVTYPKMN